MMQVSLHREGWGRGRASLGAAAPRMTRGADGRSICPERQFRDESGAGTGNSTGVDRVGRAVFFVSRASLLVAARHFSSAARHWLVGLG